ncbi:MAG: DUF1778 domain-containing protein [Magnetococcus sp. DMHC-1]
MADTTLPDEGARHVLAKDENLLLTPRDWDAFFEVMDRTNRPRPKLERAARDYLAWRQNQAIT